MITISHFEFNLDGTWCMLQGSGGPLGGGACHIDPCKPRTLVRAMRSLQARAIYSLADDGCLRTVVDHAEPSKRINEVQPGAVLGCRAVLSSGVEITV